MLSNGKIQTLEGSISFNEPLFPRGLQNLLIYLDRLLEGVLEHFIVPLGIKILQYVDDLLVSGKKEADVREVSIQLLNFLGNQGLRVSKTKLQFVQKEVKYLGYLISEGKRRINPKRIAGITSLTLPKTKWEVRQLLGLLGYCRLWIHKYTQLVKFLYEKLVGKEPIQWQ